MSKQIKFATPDVSLKEILSVSKAIRSRWLTNGPVVKQFESEIKNICKADRAVALDSCTAAMELSLRALGIGHGDEVITTPYTYTATAEAIRNVGAKIVFSDIYGMKKSRPYFCNRFEMDYENLRSKITEKTKAIIPVDIGGIPCNYERLMLAINTSGVRFKPSSYLQQIIGRIAIVSDSAHSFGAMHNFKPAGRLADFTCFSFHVLKNITTGGEGGAVVWKNFYGYNNDELETEIRLLADHGQTTRDKTNGWEYDIELFGYNSIMTNIDAAMGLAQLERLPSITQKRKKVTETYNALFEKYADSSAMVPALMHDSFSAMHLYPVLFLKDEMIDSNGDNIRDKIFLYMKNRGIPCNVHYKPLPKMTAYKEVGFDISNYPFAEDLSDRILTIPYHTELTKKQQEYIVKTLVKAYEMAEVM